MDVWVVIDFLSSQTTYDYLSVIVGGITGALFACDRDLDIVGAVTLGLMTGYGGGVVRDILLDGHGFYFMQHADLVLIAAAICAFVFFFQGVFKHLDATVFFADALSVGLFALAGASKAVSCDVGFVYAVLLGAITGVGGGAIRDVCVGEVPGVFKESNFYAVASLGGALMYVVAVYAGSPSLVASLLCVFTVVALRYWSVYFDWRTSAPTDLTPVLSRTVKAIFLHGSSKRDRRHFRGIFHMGRAGSDGAGRTAGEAAGERPHGAGLDDGVAVGSGVREEDVAALGEFERGQRGQGGEPSEPSQPGESSQPGDPGDPGEPGEPGQSGQPGEPGESSQPGDPGDPGESCQPHQPSQPGEPSQHGQGAASVLCEEARSGARPGAGERLE